MSTEEKLDETRPELEAKLAELDIMRQSLEEAKAKEKEIYDQLLRLKAEFENFRKRNETRTTEAIQYGKEDILLQVLTMADGLSQAVQASQTTTDMDSLKKGLELVNQLFEKFLKDQGLEAIDSVGQTLDPNKHEAMAQEPTDEAEDGTIVGEIQKGYMMGNRVIRTAKVRVATNSKQEKLAKANQEEK